MKKFKVRAAYKTFYSAEVEAEDGDHAVRIAVFDMDQSDFTEDPGGGEWIIEDDELPEEIKSHWANDEDYPVEGWQAEVANDDTRQSYADWVASQRGEE